MKYLIVSIYDCGCEFSVCNNGKEVIDSEEEYNAYIDHIDFDDIDFGEWLKNKYKDYDLIVICEDGNTQVIVDKITQ